MQMILTAELEMSKSTIYRVCSAIALIAFTYLATGLVAQNIGSAAILAPRGLVIPENATYIASAAILAIVLFL